MRITGGTTVHYPDRRPLLARVVAECMRVLMRVAWEVRK
jgi:hypothetical protein